MHSPKLRPARAIMLFLVVSSSYSQHIWLSSGLRWNTDFLSKPLFVENHFIVKTDNAIFTTSDGQTWNYNTSNNVWKWSNKDIFYSNNQYFSIGQKRIGFSKDLIHWDSTVFEHEFTYGPSFAYGNNRYVISNVKSSSKSLFISSVDCKNWSYDTVNCQVQSIVFADTQFVAVGNKILTSPDGITWTVQKYVPPYTLNYVAILNGNYVAVGDSGTVLMSTDGVQWENKSIGYSFKLLSVAFGNGMYVASGHYSSLLVSKDGSSWNLIHSNESYYSGRYFVAFGNSRFIAIGPTDPVRTSTDGINWLETSFPDINADSWGYTSVNYCHDRFIFTGKSGFLATTPNTVEWAVFPAAPYSSKSTANTLYSAAFGAGKYIAIGDTSLISSNGTDWLKMLSGTSRTLHGKLILFEQNKFIGLDGRDVWTSPDGINWKTITDTLLPGKVAIAYGNNTFIATGYKETSSFEPSPLKMLTSTDAEKWSSVNIDTIWKDNVLRAFNSSSVAYGNKRFVTVGGYHQLEWSNNSIFGYIKKGYTGYILYSDDGARWSRAPLTVTYPLKSVAYGNNHFVAIGGDSGNILISTDGILWKDKSINKVHDLSAVSVAYGDNRFVFAGNFYNSTINTRVTYVSLADDSNYIYKGLSFNKNNSFKVTFTQDEITIHSSLTEFNQQVQIRLYSAKGSLVYKTLFQTKNHNIMKISTHGLASGIYFLKTSGLNDGIQIPARIMITH